MLKVTYRIFFLLLLTGLVALIHSEVFSQNEKLDSLFTMLKRTDDNRKIRLLYAIAYEFATVNNDYKSGLSYADAALRAASSYQDTIGTVEAGGLKSQLLRRTEQLDSSIALSLKILPMARGKHMDAETKSLLNGLGISYMFKGNYDNALIFMFQVLEIGKDEQNDRQVGIALLM